MSERSGKKEKRLTKRRGRGRVRPRKIKVVLLPLL
jgi:hypothetical protein